MRLIVFEKHILRVKSVNYFTKINLLFSKLWKNQSIEFFYRFRNQFSYIRGMRVFYST